MAICERPFNSLDELHETQLEYFKMMLDTGVAVPAAMHYCTEHGLNAPPWLMRAATDLIVDLLKREKSKKRGRAASAVARYRQDMIDLARWDAIREVREKQKEFREDVEKLRTMPNVRRDLLEERRKMLEWLGRGSLRAYECAAMLLIGTEAFAGPDAMKKAYGRVERNSVDPKQATRYHVLQPRFLRRLGLESLLNVKPGKKFKPFYDLTL